ncbi:hypothetical protein AYX14_07163 [Cryptococcus neoformans]|nr:hypothetical protein AYX14_07163 [Cryptococcus neoformans var. grubii]
MVQIILGASVGVKETTGARIQLSGSGKAGSHVMFTLDILDADVEVLEDVQPAYLSR